MIDDCIKNKVPSSSFHRNHPYILVNRPIRIFLRQISPLATTLPQRYALEEQPFNLIEHRVHFLSQLGFFIPSTGSPSLRLELLP
jgi:hypothetical protein